MSIFMNYQGITGESADSNHPGWMDIQKVQWGVGRQISSATSTQGDRESANAEITRLYVTRYMDSATPKLFLESCCGKGKNVILHMTKTGVGDAALTYMEYTLKHAYFDRECMAWRKNSILEGRN